MFRTCWTEFIRAAVNEAKIDSISFLKLFSLLKIVLSVEIDSDRVESMPYRTDVRVGRLPVDSSSGTARRRASCRAKGTARTAAPSPSGSTKE